MVTRHGKQHVDTCGSSVPDASSVFQSDYGCSPIMLKWVAIWDDLDVFYNMLASNPRQEVHGSPEVMPELAWSAGSAIGQDCVACTWHVECSNFYNFKAETWLVWAASIAQSLPRQALHAPCALDFQKGQPSSGEHEGFGKAAVLSGCRKRRSRRACMVAASVAAGSGLMQWPSKEGVQSLTLVGMQRQF